MIFTSPIPFREALRSRQVREIMPTDLSSAELSALGVDVLEQAITSARTNDAWYLAQIEDVVRTVLQPIQAPREDGRTATEGLNLADARLRLREALAQIDYQPAPEDAGTIKDLSSDARLNLVVETNVAQAHGYGYWRQGQEDVLLDQWPAQELVRAEARMEPRNWLERWRGAGGRVVGGGRMVAIKNDPIWTAISRFGTPYPPFDFNSGMDVIDIDRDEAMELGLIDRDTRIEPQRRPFERN